MVVFTSGIVDDALALGAVSSQYYSVLSGVQLAVCWWVVGVEPGGVVVGVGVDTLLSPEASAVRQILLWPVRTGALRWGVLAWVGVFLVNWIVDASIFATACRHPAPLVWGGRCCDVLTTAFVLHPVSPWGVVL